MLESLLIKRYSITQVFCCEYCVIFKKNSFCRTPPVAAPEFGNISDKRLSLQRLVHYEYLKPLCEPRRLSEEKDISLALFSLHQRCENMKTIPTNNPAGICMFKVNNRNTRTRCEICSKLKKDTRPTGVVLVSLLLTLNIFHTLF